MLVRDVWIKTVYFWGRRIHILILEEKRNEKSSIEIYGEI